MALFFDSLPQKLLMMMVMATMMMMQPLLADLPLASWLSPCSDVS
jgi:hypothetical protein